MTDAFDPYFKWLGIPRADQPPHAYRLLGIELFESDADVISNAVDGRMAQIKSFQAGKFAAISQKLLNEIAAAKVCLLKPEKKAEYDRRLRARLQQKSAAASTKAEIAEAEVVPENGEDGAGLSFLDYSTTPKRNTVRPAKKSTDARAWLIPLGIVGGALAVLAGVAVYLSFAGDGKTKQASSLSASLNSGTQEVPPNRSSGSLDKSSTASASQHSAKPTGTTTASARDSAADPVSTLHADPVPSTPEVAVKPKIDLTADPEKPVTPEPQVTKSKEDTADNAVTHPPAPEKETAKKPPIPDKDQYQAMKNKILKIFQKEFAEAKTAEAKLALAEKLNKQGDTSKDDPVERYSLWRMAIDEASMAGEFSAAMEIIDKIQGQFDVDADVMKAEVLSASAARSTISPEAARDLCETALKLAAAAVARDDFDTAARFAKLASGSARRVKDPQFSRDVLAREREIEHFKARYAVVAKAMETLSSSPDDAAANLAVGQWRCLVKDDWETGLPCLAKGSREDLAALAKQELAKPADTKEQVALADGWLAVAEKDRSDLKPHYQARAVHWYEQAAPGLSGLEKIRVDKQIAATKQGTGGEAGATSTAPRSFGPRGTMQKGNVATLANGATVVGPTMCSETMLTPDATTPATQAPVPCQFIVTLDKTYQLQQIRFRLYTGWDAAYQIFTSRDGQRFELLQDHSGLRSVGWQEFRFTARPVKAIKMVCTGTSKNDFMVDRFEAYCYVANGDGGVQRARAGKQ